MLFFFSILVYFSLLSSCMHSSDVGVCSGFPFLQVVLPLSCSTLQSLKSAPVIQHGHPPSLGPHVATSWCSSQDPSLLCTWQALHRVAVLGWVCSPPRHVRTHLLHRGFLVPPSSCPSICPAGLWPLQCLRDPSLPMLSAKHLLS